MKNAYIIMTRIPIANKTKTRLMPNLSGTQCANIHKAFLKDLFNMAYELKDYCDIYVSYLKEGDLQQLLSITPSFIKTFPQQGNSLGEKMNNSLNYLFSKGYSKVVLTGSDIPSLNKDTILTSFDFLNTKDITIGPTVDGGYYLIGSKSPINNILLSPITFGCCTVLENTLNIIKNNKKSVAILKEFRDIDTFDDLIYFKSHCKKHCHTINFINSLNL